MASFPGRLPDRPILPAPEGAPHSPRLKAALQGGGPVHATMLPNGMLEHLHPGLVRTVGTLMRRPVYIVHPTGMAKAWPKDAAENQANEQAFLSHPVAMDQAIEATGAVPSVHTPSNGAGDVYNPAASIRDTPGRMLNPATFNAHLANFAAARNPAGPRRVPVMTPFYDSGVPAMSFQGLIPDLRHEEEFWQDTEAQAEGRSLASLRSRAAKRAAAKTKLGKAENGIVADLAAELAGRGEHIPALLTPFGTVGGPGTAAASSAYNLSDRLNEVEELVKRHGYKTVIHSGRYGSPDPTHTFSRGVIGIEDPGTDDASAFNHERAKRALHGLAQALTEPEIGKIYPDAGPVPGQRDVHWEDMASRKQRELAGGLGIHLPDEAFNREHNTAMANAVHCAVGGAPAPLSQIGFAPHSHEVPLAVALDLVRDSQSMAKAEQPSTVLHGTVEGFMQGLKALPKGSPARGKFITAHMGHPGFISALKAHAQGQQIHQMLTAHLNSPVNAGPGRGVVTAKSENNVILSQETNVADNINRKAALERIKALQTQIESLRKRESVAKALIPPHKHNVGVTVGQGVEDVAPGRMNPDGKNDPLRGGTAVHNMARKNELLAGEKSAERSREESTEGSREESSVFKGELCKGCGKSECFCSKKSELVDSKGSHSSDDVVTKMPKESKEVSTSGSGGQIKRGKSLSEMRKAAMSMSKAGYDWASRGGDDYKQHMPKNKKPKDWKFGDPGAKFKEDPEDPEPKSDKQISSLGPKSATKKAEPPMAKPPSGVSMATKIPASKPGNAMKPAAGGQLPKPTVAPKMPGLGKGVMSDIAHRESEAMGAPKAAAAAPKTALPGQQEQADRASMFSDAMAGAYTPPAAVKPRVLAVNPIGVAPATKPRPGIFGRLGLSDRPSLRPPPTKPGK